MHTWFVWPSFVFSCENMALKTSDLALKMTLWHGNIFSSQTSVTSENWPPLKASLSWSPNLTLCSGGGEKSSRGFFFPFVLEFVKEWVVKSLRILFTFAYIPHRSWWYVGILPKDGDFIPSGKIGYLRKKKNQTHILNFLPINHLWVASMTSKMTYFRSLFFVAIDEKVESF